MSLYQTIKDSLPALGRFTARPAAIIDEAYLNETEGLVSRAWSFSKIRAVYTFFFIPMAALDLAISAVMFGLYAITTLFTATTTDALQKNQISNESKYATIFGKSLRALLFSPLGLLSPKLTAFYFTPEKNHLQGVQAGGSYYSAPNALLKQPEDVEELQEIITCAAAKGQKIIPKGAGFSQGKQFLAEGSDSPIVIDLSRFNTIDFNTDDKTEVTVGAGARWVDIQREADKRKLALSVMQASNVFSVGGSIATNIHGWDIHSGVLSSTILSMDIVNAEGKLQTITPSDALFHQITGGLGLFGIVVRVKMKLVDNLLLKEQGTAILPKDYIQHFHDNVEHNDNVKMHLYRLSLDPATLLATGVAVDYVTTENKKPVRSVNLDVEEARGTRTNQILVNLARRFDFIRKWYWDGESKRLVDNQSAPMTTNEIMRPPINAMFNPSVSEAEWLQEYFLPEDQLNDFLTHLSQILTDNEVPLLNASVRFVKQHNESPLSYAQGSDKFAVVLCFNQSLRESKVIQAKKWLREAQQLAISHGGTYYLPYQHVSSPEDFKAAYPRAEEAQKFKEIVDPEGMFTSGFHQKYMAPKPVKTNHFKAIMANEDTKKEFSGFLKNVLQRVDSSEFFTLLEDVMKYNDSHEEIYQELCKRLPEITPALPSQISNILGSLSAIKQDLGDQAHALLPKDLHTIDGLVEIGYPGRFVDGFKQHYKITGKIVAAYEAQSITDYIQTGFPRPYDEFKTLDYNKPNLTGLLDNSADVITCYVGLHHFPKEELDIFLKDVRRVLRSGGHFILVDHDVIDAQSLSMAHMAHMIFNATSGTSLEEEMNELRDFQPMSYWREQLAKHSLGYAVEEPDVAMIREGDPSRNRMVSFVNAPKLELEKVKEEATAPIVTASPAGLYTSPRASSTPSEAKEPFLSSAERDRMAFLITSLEDEEEEESEETLFYSFDS